MPWKQGDSCLMIANGEQWLASVGVASSNQRSIGLTFDGHCLGHRGFMPILLDEDGVYRSIIDASVTVELQPWDGFGSGSVPDSVD
jgi:hypothetical protein